MKTGREEKKKSESAIQPDGCFHSPTPHGKIDVRCLFPGAEPLVLFDSFTLVVLTNDAVQLEAP